jgi:hypothetical protein
LQGGASFGFKFGEKALQCQIPGTNSSLFSLYADGNYPFRKNKSGSRNEGVNDES